MTYFHLNFTCDHFEFGNVSTLLPFWLGSISGGERAQISGQLRNNLEEPGQHGSGSGLFVRRWLAGKNLKKNDEKNVFIRFTYYKCWFSWFLIGKSSINGGFFRWKNHRSKWWICHFHVCCCWEFSSWAECLIFQKQDRQIGLGCCEICILHILVFGLDL